METKSAEALLQGLRIDRSPSPSNAPPNSHQQQIIDEAIERKIEEARRRNQFTFTRSIAYEKLVVPVYQEAGFEHAMPDMDVALERLPQHIFREAPKTPVVSESSPTEEEPPRGEHINGYVKINNTLLWECTQLPKPQQLIFLRLRIHSDYETHVSTPMKMKQLVELTGSDRANIFRAVKALEKAGWITRLDTGSKRVYQWELSIAKLTNQGVYEFLHAPKPIPEPQLELEPEPEPTPELEPEPAIAVVELNGQQVNILTHGPRSYRFNAEKQDFETKPLWKQDSWELANGHIEYISEDEKRELQNMPFFT